MNSQHTLYRRDDPHTSREAAASVYPHLTKIQLTVLGLLRSAEYGLTDEEITDRYPVRGGLSLSPSTARTRRKELTDKGYVIACTIRTRKLRSGRRGKVWMTTSKGQQLCLL